MPDRPLIDRKDDLSDVAEQQALSWADKARQLRRKRLLQRLGIAASIVLFVTAVAVLYLVIRELDVAKVKEAYYNTSWQQIAIALVLTALSYLCLTFYDALALKQLSPKKVPYRLTALASFTSFAVSFNLGFPLLTAATVRFWVYAPAQLGAGVIAALTLIAGVTFWLGMSIVLGLAMVLYPSRTAAFTRLPADTNFYIGAAVLGGVLLYVIWIALKPRRITMQGWTFQVPRLGVSLGQMLLGAADVCIACGVLFVLMPSRLANT